MLRLSLIFSCPIYSANRRGRRLPSRACSSSLILGETSRSLICSMLLLGETSVLYCYVDIISELSVVVERENGIMSELIKSCLSVVWLAKPATPHSDNF